MSSRSRWSFAILAVALVVSLAFSALVLSDNSRLSNDNTTAATHLEMNAILTEAQISVQQGLQRIGSLMAGNSANISAVGLNGTVVREQLNASLAADACFLDIVTYDTTGKVIAAEPSSYHYLEGMDLGGFEIIDKLLSTKMPVMSGVIPPQGGLPGAVLSVPVFDTDGQFIGAVSALFYVPALMNETISGLVSSSDYTFWCMQTDGQDIYDTDGSQIGMNILHGPDYAAYPEVQAIGYRMLNETSGYGTYSYLISLNSTKTVQKECYWTTVGLMGVEWRLVIVHRL
ncbi:MAG: hypothetical protein A4E32_00521 [Methanomassiliicoccales archaeon PtaU1.Bin124]|nr:MAG: hypothetical protein A4E32_00521 [Methanomassiliicoccales archaeon PtaU1.Bin124]